jgi:diguanylate cyclase (GGDEF)-like protein
MDSAGLLNDVLVMASAIGSAIAGVICGWQFRGGHEARKVHLAARAAADKSRAPQVEVVIPSEAKSPAEDLSFLPDRPIKKVLFEPHDDGFLRYDDSFATAYGEPQGLTQSDIRQVAERLIHMADLITADVDAHDARLSEVNTTLDFKQSPPTLDSVMSAVEKLMSANQDMQDQLRSSRDRIVEQAHEIESAERRANTDALTQVNNRRAFDRALAEWNGETPGVLALLDIDHFKQFNDQHGHRVGDEVLRAVAAVLRSQLRNHCIVARYGGEEFGLVFMRHELDDVLDFVEATRLAIAANEVIFEGQSFRVTCSMGVTRMLAGEPSAHWLQRADDGLYLSKDAGRNCGHCIDSKVLGTREAPFRLGMNELQAIQTRLHPHRYRSRHQSPIGTRAVRYRWKSDGISVIR